MSRGSLSKGVNDVTDPGVYVLVKMPEDTAEELLIQGRYVYTRAGPTRSSLQGIAVSGSLIDNHELVIEYKTSGSDNFEFSVKWDDHAVVEKKW